MLKPITSWTPASHRGGLQALDEDNGHFGQLENEGLAKAHAHLVKLVPEGIESEKEQRLDSDGVPPLPFLESEGLGDLDLAVSGRVIVEEGVAGKGRLAVWLLFNIAVELGESEDPGAESLRGAIGFGGFGPEQPSQCPLELATLDDRKVDGRGDGHELWRSKNDNPLKILLSCKSVLRVTIPYA